MRLLVSWVRDFVDVTASVEQIADTLGVRGFEVASVEPLPDGDGVIDFEVTANRPDCLSVIGLAREIGTAYDLPIVLPSSTPDARVPLASVPTGESDQVSVTVEDAELCPRYAAAVADITNATTPAWMTKRLQAAGVRPISPIVDITNYVLMELGHPMHAFDLATLEDHALRIRRARPKEEVTTLDGVKRTLDADMLVIADGRRAQAVAGVMGGAASEVSAATRTVVFESAYFKPASVRRTSKRLGLKTEASSRFERGADVNAPVVALQRAIALMERVGAGRVRGPIVDRFPVIRDARTLHLRRARLALVLGMGVPDREVERILSRLGLGVTATADGWDVTAPTFRVDLAREVDLIEEVGRHFGLDTLEATFPPMTVAAAPTDPRILRDHLTRNILTAAGLSEAITFAFIEAKAAEAFAAGGHTDDLVAIANPLSGKFGTLRPSILPGLVDAVAHNRRHGRRDVALFEIGARFSNAEGETHAVGIAWTGAASEHWSSASRSVDFYDVKGVVEALCGSLGITPRFAPSTSPHLVAGRTASVSANGSSVGIVGLLSPAVAEGRGAPRQDEIFVAELDLDRVQSSASRSDALVAVRALPRHPFVVRDLSAVVSDALPAEIIRGTIQRAGAGGRANLAAITFFDRYQGKGLSEGTVSLSVRLTFQAPDRTLTDAEVQDSFDRILNALVSEHGAIQR